MPQAFMSKIIIILSFIIFPISFYAQSVVGKWKVIKSTPTIETNSKEATQAIYEELDAYSNNEYDTFVQFGKGGEYTEYALGTKTEASYNVRNGKLNIFGENIDRECTYSVAKDTLIYHYDYTKSYNQSYLERLKVPVSNSVNVQKAILNVYLVKLSDNYNITEAIEKEMEEKSIFIKSKHPETVKDDITGNWTPIKTVPVVITNNRKATHYLDSIISSVYNNEETKKPIVIDKEYVNQDYKKIRYSIDGNTLKVNGKGIAHFAINDSILTIDRDVDEDLLWIGMDIWEHMIVRKSIVRTYYKKTVIENARYNGTQEDLTAFIDNNLQYPPLELAYKVEATVLVAFKVQADGTISNIDIAKKIYPRLDAEAMRVIGLSSGNWIPRKENGVAVDSFIVVPVVFKVSKKKK